MAAKTARGTGIAAARQFITTGSTGSVTVTWAAVAGATGYVIYGRTPYAERV